MGIKAVLCHLDLSHRHVAAMVADAFIIGQEIVQHKAVLNGAAAGLEPGNMVCLDGAHQLVDHRLQRLYLAGKVQVSLAECVGGAVQDILHRIFQHLQFLPGIPGESNVLLVHLLGGFQQIYGMVADPLKIADGVEKGVDALAVGMAQFPSRELYQIGAQRILVAVHLAFVLPYLLGKLLVPGVGQAHRLHHAHPCQLCHVGGGAAGTLHGNGGGVQQTVIQQSVAFLFRAVWNGKDCQLFQQGSKGQQHSGGKDIEHRVDHRNAPSLNGGVYKGKVTHRIQPVKTHQEKGHTDDVEIQMDHSGTAGVFVSAHRRKQGSDAGADVLTHDDGNGAAVGNDAGGTQCLQDAHAGTGTLDDTGDHGTHQNTQHRVGEPGEQAGEPCLVLQRQHGVGHGGHTGHKHRKADEDGADAFFLLTPTHIQQNADKCKQWTERSGF